MYPSIKSLLSLTICVSRPGSTPTLTPCYCRNLSEGGRKGGIRFRLTVGESEAGLVQHLPSRWWRKSEDWVHSWNSKHVLPTYCVCSSSFPDDLQRARAYRRTDAHNVDVVWAELQGHPEQNVIIVKLMHLSVYFQFWLIYVIEYLEKKDIYKLQGKEKGEKNHNVYDYLGLNDKKSAQK